MLWYFAVGTLAAMGLMSLGWCLMGWLFPAGRDGWLLCPVQGSRAGFVPVYLWLRQLGLVRCPLLVLDLGAEPQLRQALKRKELIFCTPEQLTDWIIGESTIGRRDADHSRRSQRRGISEL